MSPHKSDAWIDDELKNVAVPGVVLQKLHAIASLDDTEIDRALCEVAPSAKLLDRLRSIGSLDEGDLDDELRHVALPVSLAERLRQIPFTMHRRLQSGVFVRRLAIAASLLIAMGVGYLAVVAPAYFGRSNRRTAESGTNSSAASQANAGKKNAGSNAVSPAIDKGEAKLVTSPPRDRASDGDLPPVQSDLPRDDGSAEQLANDGQNMTRRSDDPQSIAETTTSDSVPGASNVLGANLGNDRLPQLESLPPPVWRGITPPHDIGYDWMFQFRHRVHPFVSPARSALVACSVPLVTDTDSFDEALRSTFVGKLPAPDRIRVEEFLAAMDYGFSPPDGTPLAIRTAVGPSPWGTSGSSLLQVAAQARLRSRDRESQSHLVVILDASATMRWERRWQSVLAGLRQYIERMQSADRLTLIVMDEKAEMVAERKTSADAIDALAALPLQPSAKMANAVDAFRLAAETGERGSSVGPPKIVLLTDGGLGLGKPALEQIENTIKNSLGDARLELFDVRQEATLDAELDGLAAVARTQRIGSGEVVHVPDAGQLRWRLLELATGKPQLVATKATMKVKFKPDAVARYRLIGHEATSMATTIAGLNSALVEADLHSGEAATGLFEVYLKPDGGETIATVELTWTDPRSGAVQKAEQNVTRLQLAPSFYQSPLSLQMAALAAETAEILRGSWFTPANSHSLSHVAELGALLSTRLRGRPSFAHLMTLIEQAQRSQ